MNTPGILPFCEPSQWQVHRFGLPPDRWGSLAGQVVWVTGAGTGYGRAISVSLAAAGARPVLTGRRRTMLERTLREMEQMGIDPSGAVIAPCDITVEADVEAAAEHIFDQTGALHGLISCAALPTRGPAAPLTQGSLTTWQAMFDTNVTGQWLVARAALPRMLEGGTARMLFLTSEAGWAFTPGFGPYNVTKAALNSLAASFAMEAQAQNPGVDIQVNVLDPAQARTEMNGGSEISPYAVVSAALALASHPPGGPNGRFFIRDGRHPAFAYAEPWPSPLI